MQSLFSVAKKQLDRQGSLVILYSDLACKLDLAPLDWL